MSALEQLLVVQERDAAIDVLVHRRETHPARAALVEVDAAIGAVDQRLVGARAARDDVAARQAAFEADATSASQRAQEIDKRMYSGTVSATRDLMAMGEEVKHLKERQAELEEHALEAMVELEPLDAEVSRLESERAALEARRAELVAELAAAESEIDAAIAAEQSARAEQTAGVPAELLTTYDRLRQRSAGVGAARLVGGSCTGCHLTLPSAEVERIKRLPADEVVFCDSCGRILVR